MKKSFKFMAVIAVIICLVIAFAVTANAYGEITYQDGIYSYTVSKGQATIVNTVEMLEGDVVIPSTLGGYPVVEIGNRAFQQEDEATSFVIPETVTKMGHSAFQSCMNLESVTLPKSLTKISEEAFYYCPNLNNVVIPDSVTEIGDYAFAGCWQLTDITFGSNVTTLGDMVFYDCKGLTSIAIPDTITSFGYQMFGYCDNLEEVKLPANITEIPMETFTQCFNLTDVTMPKKITSIGYSAFNSCEALKSIEIPATVKTIYDGAFYECEALKYIYYGGTKAQWAGITVEDGNDELKNATVFYGGNGPVASQFAVTYKLRCTASIDNTAKTLTAKWDGSSTKTIVFKINANVAGGDTLEVSDIKGGTVSLNNNVLTVAPNNANVSFKVKIIEDSGAVTVLNATANFGYPNFILDSTMVKNVVRASTSVDGATINVVTATGEQTSSMRVKFALPAGATLSVANGADKTYLTEHSATVLEVKNPGVGRLTVPMVLKDSDGVTMPMTLKADFGNKVRYITNCTVAQNGNDITVASGTSTAYVVFDTTGIDGGYIEVENVSRNLLDRYVIVDGVAVRFYNPVYDNGNVTVNIKNGDGEIVKTYNVTVIFHKGKDGNGNYIVTEYTPIHSVLRCAYEVEGDDITVFADAGARDVYLNFARYQAESLSSPNADKNVAKQTGARSWRVLRSDGPVEFDVIFDASTHGGEVITRHVTVIF